MGYFTLLFVAIGLSVDSFAVSLSCGLIMSKITFWKASRIGFSLAAFQAAMPIVGWFIGIKIEKYVINFDHWLAFGLLSLIGGKMIFESLRTTEDDHKRINPLDLKILLGMSLATSIDALVVGVSFAFIEVNLYITSFIIGFTTFFFSMLGILFGKKSGKHFGRNMEIIGGIMLILIGIKILLDHLTA